MTRRVMLFGTPARHVVLDADPRADIRNVRRISRVIEGGRHPT